MTTSASGRSRSAGIRTSSVTARKTAVPVAAATLRLATRPSSASAPITVSRSQRPHGTLPVARRPLPPGGAGVGAGHPGVDAGLVDEDQAGGIDAGQLGAPGPPRLGHALAIPLGGLERLFFRTRPSALSARHRAEGLRRTPVRSASRSAYSASVASFRSATRAASVAASPPTGFGPPPSGLGARRPSSRAALSQLESVRSPTR